MPLLFVASKGSYVQNYRRGQIFSSSLLKYQLYTSLTNDSILILGATVLHRCSWRSPPLWLPLRHPACVGALQPVSRISLHWFYLSRAGIESTLTFAHQGQREVVFCSAFLRSGRARLIQSRAIQETYNFSWIKGFVLLLFSQALLFKNSREFLQLSSEIVWLWFGNHTIALHLGYSTWI